MIVVVLVECSEQHKQEGECMIIFENQFILLTIKPI